LEVLSNARRDFRIRKSQNDIFNIILAYERNKPLNPEEINNLTKIEKLQTIDKRDREINNAINSSKISTIHRIVNFNSERISALVKRKIVSSARKYANEMVKEKNKLGRDADEVYATSFREVSRKFTQLAVSTMRAHELKRYKENKENYVLKTK